MTGSDTPLRNNWLAKVCLIAWGPFFRSVVSILEWLIIFLTDNETTAPFTGLYGAKEDRNICLEEEPGLPYFT